MMLRSFHIYRLDGYTGGRPSWLKYGAAPNKAEAERRVAELQKKYPNMKLRIRVAPKLR